MFYGAFVLSIRVTLAEQNLERLTHFFKLSTAAFISPVIGPTILGIMDAHQRQDFFRDLSFILKRPVTSSREVTQQDLQLLNQTSAFAMKGLKYPQLSVLGQIAYEGATVDLRNVGVFHSLSAKEATEIAALYFQRAFIFVQRGNFYLYTSPDCRSFSIAEHSQSPEGTQFKLSFDQGDGGDAMQHLAKVKEEASVFSELHEDKGKEILANGNIMPVHQAEHELAMWIAEIEAQVSARNFKAAKHGLSVAQGYIDALSAL